MFIAADDTRQNGTSTQRGHVVGRVATRPWYDLRRVIFQDENRRFARNPGYTPID